MERHHHRQVGTYHRKGRILHRVRFPATIRGREDYSTVRPADQGGAHTSFKGSDSSCTKGTETPWFLLALLRSSKKRRRSAPHTGLARCQHFHLTKKVQDDFSDDNPTPSQEHILVRLHRPHRCILPHRNTPFQPAIPTLRCGKSRLSVSGTPLRTLHSTSRLYKMYGRRVRTLQSQGHTDSPVHRRLARRRRLPRRPNSSHQLHSKHPTGPRVTDQQREIPTDTNTIHQVHRRHPGRIQSKGIPPAGSSPILKTVSTQTHNAKDSDSSHNSTPTRAHGRHYRSHPSRQTENAETAELVQQRLQPPLVCQKDAAPSTGQSHQVNSMVDAPQQPPSGHTFSTPHAIHDLNHGRLAKRMGSPPPRHEHTGPVVQKRTKETHKSPGITSGLQGTPRLRDPTIRTSYTDHIGQHNGSLLHQQTGGHQITQTDRAHAPHLGVVHPQRDHPDGSPHSRRLQCTSRQAQQSSLDSPRVAAPPGCITPTLPQVGHTHTGPIRDGTQRSVPPLLQQGRQGNELPRGCIHTPLERSSHLPLPANPPDHTGPSENSTRQLRLYADHALVAQARLVPCRTEQVERSMASPTTPTGPDHSGSGQDQTCRPGQPPPHSMAPTPGVANDNTNTRILTVLEAALKPSTRKAYEAKWNAFKNFASAQGASPTSCHIHVILNFLIQLTDKGLKFPSIKVYLAAISAHHDTIEGYSVFSYPMTKRFLKGLHNLNPPVTPPCPSWSLSVVLHSLSSKPFEPMATTDLRLLTWKVAFLVAITSARRASELAALRVDEPYLTFHKDKVVLRPDMRFLPKVVSNFHVNQDIVLPTFFPTPSSPLESTLHTLDVRRALAFYKHRTLAIRKSQQLFVCYGQHCQGTPVSTQRLSNWLVQCITLAYQVAKLDPPTTIKGHSTRAIATSSAFQRGVAIPTICKAATWSQPSTFARHYRLDVRAREDSSFGRAVLSSILN